MRITLNQTGSNDDMQEQHCCICSGRFYLGPATCFAYSDNGRCLWGEVCPRCIAGGPEEIQRRLDMKARWARLTAEQEEQAADEGVEDCPTLDEVLAAETFYGRPMFKTGEEYEDALRRGEIT